MGFLFLKMKTICQICNFRADSSELLVGLNPFDLTEPIHGCPRCKSINSFYTCCEEVNCWEQDTCGTPTPAGYKRLCSVHYIRECQKQEYQSEQAKITVK